MNAVRHIITAILLALGTCASESSLAQAQQSDTAQQIGMEFPTPLVYYRWWNDVQECVGKTRDLAQVHFRVMPTPTWDVRFVSAPGAKPDSVWRVRGLYHDPTATIYLGLGYEIIAPVVRHEMAHAILHHTGNTHPADVFEKCHALFDVPSSVTSDTGSVDDDRKNHPQRG